MWGWLAKMFAGGVGDLVKAGGDIYTSIAGDQKDRDKADADRSIAALNQYAAEFAQRQNRTYWDAFVDGLNRLPRPLIAFGVIALFVWCAVDPVTFIESMQALAIMPENMWIVLTGVVGFYFLGRSLEVGKKMKVEKEALKTAREISAARAERRAQAAAEERTAEQAAAASATAVPAAPQDIIPYTPAPISAPLPPMGEAAGAALTIDRAAFFRGYRERLLAGATTLKQSQVDGIDLVMDEMLRNELALKEAAYVLATAYHEAARTWQPIREYGGLNKRYAPYYGRGLVQLTWKQNYKKFSDLLGIDLVGNPDLALDPHVSVTVLVTGMMRGMFTGKTLSDYWSGESYDYVEARRVVNAMDRAEMIAGFARHFEEILRASDWPEGHQPQV